MVLGARLCWTILDGLGFAEKAEVRNTRKEALTRAFKSSPKLVSN